MIRCKTHPLKVSIKVADSDKRKMVRDMQAARAQAAGPATAQAEAPAAPAAGGLSDDAIARLKQLSELHQQGILTDAEFADQKARILG